MVYQTRNMTFPYLQAYKFCITKDFAVYQSLSSPVQGYASNGFFSNFFLLLSTGKNTEYKRQWYGIQVNIQMMICFAKLCICFSGNYEQCCIANVFL